MLGPITSIFLSRLACRFREEVAVTPTLLGGGIAKVQKDLALPGAIQELACIATFNL
jgi:hypothetical protein